MIISCILYFYSGIHAAALLYNYFLYGVRVPGHIATCLYCFSAVVMIIFLCDL